MRSKVRSDKKRTRAIPHNSKCRYGERGAADAKPKAQIILDAAKVSAASGGNSEPKQGQRSQSARGFCPRSTMRVPQPDIIEHFGNADAVPQPPERCLSRKAGIVRYCPKQQSAGLLLAAFGRPTCSNPTSSSTKKDPQPQLRISFGGSWWIRTTEALSSRFTVCPHWPLGKAPIFICTPALTVLD